LGAARDWKDEMAKRSIILREPDSKDSENSEWANIRTVRYYPLLPNASFIAPP
jgi:hypothetical protein